MPKDESVTSTRKLMELAVEAMRKSRQEKRDDKVSPLVGAVLVMPDGTIETACRGELSDSEHAEYTLLERKLLDRDLTNSTLFVTLEPCAPGSRTDPKVCCAKRIVRRRISKVWVGIEDPDPLVDSKGIQYLQSQGVEVNLFDRDLQGIIRKDNAAFIKGAEERASVFEVDQEVENLHELEAPLLSATFDDFDTEELRRFNENAFESGYYPLDSSEFHQFLIQLKYLARRGENLHPTGLGVLLFGKNPQAFFPHAVIRATYKAADAEEDIETFKGSLPKQSRDSVKWAKRMIGRRIDRSASERKERYDYPIEVVRESINNALAHRSYDNESASIYLEVDDNSIIVRSPGEPVKPISMERMKTLDAPYLSKNPKITYAFEQLGLSENRGLGLRTIRDLPKKYNLPLPSVTYDDPYLTFAFSRAYGLSTGDNNLDRLSETEAIALDYIRLNSPVTRREYEEFYELSTKTAERHLARLVELNLIERKGAGPSTNYVISEEQ